MGAAGGRGPERSPRPRTPRPGPGFCPAGGSLPRGHRRGVTAVGSPPWVPGNAARSACLRPLDRARQTPGSGLGSGDHRESGGSPRGEPRVLAGPVLGAEGRTIRTTEVGGLWAEAPRRPQARGSGGGCGQLASDCPVSPGKTPCRDRTGTSTLALTTRPSPAPSAPQGPRPAPGESPSGALVALPALHVRVSGGALGCEAVNQRLRVSVGMSSREWKSWGDLFSPPKYR